jgi:SAM-dependent methyltransferase
MPRKDGVSASIDIRAYNRRAWNKQAEYGNPWTVPVTPEVIAEARLGRWSVLLTPLKPVPVEWFPPMQGLDVLGLASGGGQQGPVFAALGANVTVLDNSPRQLERDRQVAEREKLTLQTVEGDMRDLSMFADASFDLVFHPVANVFVPNVLAVWQKVFRVLRPGGVLLSGFMNPSIYMVDIHDEEAETPRVRYPLPYSDLDSLSPEEKEEYLREDSPLEWSHSLEAQIGGQLAAGFSLTGLYEDHDPYMAISRFTPVYIATRAVKGK